MDLESLARRALVAGIRGGEARGRVRRLLEERQARIAFEKHEVVHGSARRRAIESLELRLQRVGLHERCEVLLADTRVRREDGPPPLREQRVLDHRGLLGIGRPGARPRPGRRADQAAFGGVQDHGRVWEALEGLEHNPVAPGHETRPHADLRLLGNLEPDVVVG
jgi:hypothetical protein